MTRNELYKAADEGDIVALNRIRDLFGQEEANFIRQRRAIRIWRRAQRAKRADFDVEHSKLTRAALAEKKLLSPDEFAARQAERRRAKQRKYWHAHKVLIPKELHKPRASKKPVDRTEAIRRALEEKRRLSPEEFAAKKRERRQAAWLRYDMTHRRNKARDLQTLPV